MSIELSFVICFHTARTDNLLQTLRFLVKDHPTTKYQLVTVCQDSCPLRLGAGFAGAKHVDMNLDRMGLPQLTNHGVSLADCDRVVVLESDRILPAGYFKFVVENVKPGLVISAKQFTKLHGPTRDDDIVAGKFSGHDERRSPENTPGMRNVWSGNTAFHKSDYLKAGGMDEAYRGYGWADNDMACRMASCGVKTLLTDHHELHLWHPEATYGAGDQKAMFIDNGLRFCKKWGATLPDWFRDDIAKHRSVMP